MPKSRSNIRFIEIAVRIVCAVACAGAVVAGAFSINKIIDINSAQVLVFNLRNIVDLANDNLRQRTEAAAGLAVAAGIIIPLEIIMVFLRLFKIKLGAFGRILAVLDLLVTVIAFCGFGAAGVLSAMAANDWKEDVINGLNQVVPPGDIFDFFFGNLTDIRNNMIATAVCSFFACGWCALLFFLVIVMLVKHNRLDYNSV